MHDRHDLTDEQWEILEPFLPNRTPVRGGQWKDQRITGRSSTWIIHRGPRFGDRRLSGW